MSLATWVPFQHGAETLCCSMAILHGTKPYSALTRELYIAVLSIFFFLDLVSGDLALTGL